MNLKMSPQPESPPPQEQQQGDPTARPVHHLEHIRVGDNGVQLLVSTQDHVYDAKDVETGQHCWQVIGTWTDQSVQELTAMVSTRSTTRSGNATQSKGFGGFGTGHTLGNPSNTQRPAA